MWLSYTSDEVADFHPRFEEIANKCLEKLKLGESYTLVHHDPSSKGGIPDYVLQEKNSSRWIVVIEIKKTRSAVTSSTQYRRQAHSYALENKHRFKTGQPFLYCLTNLEETHLFGANDQSDLAVSPNSRLVKSWTHGEFEISNEQEHKEQLFNDLCSLFKMSIDAKRPLSFRLNFPATWDVIKQAGEAAGPSLPEHWSGGDYSSWFSTFSDNTARGILLATQLLLAEWIVYQSEQHHHPDRKSLVRFSKKTSSLKNRNHAADVIQRILQIDFEDVLGGAKAPNEIRNLNKQQAHLAINRIIEELEDIQLDQLSNLVGSSGLPDLLFETLQTKVTRSRRGTVQTDPELAQIVASLGIYERAKCELILDPCAGIGNLLTAAYHSRSSELSHSENIQNLIAVEIEPIQCALSALQLMMQVPGAACKKDKPIIICDSITNAFANINRAGLVLMNPPYKRYEDDGDPLPPEYKKHLQETIKKITGKQSFAIKGQPDLYNYYVELVIAAMKEGSRGVFILNNKWINSKGNQPLRKFLVDSCAIEGVVTYPQNTLFKGHMIETTLLVFRKGQAKEGQKFRFVRCKEDLRVISADNVTGALYRGVETEQIKVASLNFSELREYSLATDGCTGQAPPDTFFREFS